MDDVCVLADYLLIQVFSLPEGQLFVVEMLSVKQRLRDEIEVCSSYYMFISMLHVKVNVTV